jgi:hypothetical protein
VVSHPLYRQLDALDAVVTFMEHHAFAVWDFMSLPKTLQRMAGAPTSSGTSSPFTALSAAQADHFKAKE